MFKIIPDYDALESLDRLDATLAKILQDPRTEAIVSKEEIDDAVSTWVNLIEYFTVDTDWEELKNISALLEDIQEK